MSRPPRSDAAGSERTAPEPAAPASAEAAPGGTGGDRLAESSGRPRGTWGIGGQAVLVCAFIACVQMTWGVIVPALPVLVEHFGLATGSIGVLIAAFAIGRVIANVPAGLALRRIPPRPFLQVVCVLLIAVTAVTGLLPNEPALLAARLVAGVLGGAAVTIGFAVIVAGAPPERRGRTMAMATVVQMSGGAIGALIGGAAVSAWGVQWAFAVAVLPLVVCLCVDLVRPASWFWSAFADRPAPDARLRPSTPVATGVPRPPGSRLLAVGLVAVAFATFFARFAGEQGLIPVLAYDIGGLDPFGLGVVMAIGTVVSIGALPLIGRVVDRGARLTVLIPSTLVAAGAVMLFPAMTAPLAFSAVLVLYYVATSVAGIVPNVVTGERFPPATAGTIIGFTRSAGDIGAALGPILVFAVADLAGPVPAVGVIAATLVLALIVLVVPIVRGLRLAQSSSRDGSRATRT
ncbi:MFS transporter [Herbiconiux sp. A18JL235]|uniref:MFS transporter n=1 Tax=Herbiconiux sp. A18JL235 TaxID=3152363 RepID=A0AB39BHW4_9MICO